MSVLGAGDLGELRSDYDALMAQLAGGEVANFAPITVQDLMNELIEAAEMDTLKL